MEMVCPNSDTGHGRNERDSATYMPKLVVHRGRRAWCSPAVDRRDAARIAKRYGSKNGRHRPIPYRGRKRWGEKPVRLQHSKTHQGRKNKVFGRGTQRRHNMESYTPDDRKLERIKKNLDYSN